MITIPGIVTIDASIEPAMTDLRAGAVTNSAAMSRADNPMMSFARDPLYISRPQLEATVCRGWAPFVSRRMGGR